MRLSRLARLRRRRRGIYGLRTLCCDCSPAPPGCQCGMYCHQPSGTPLNDIWKLSITNLQPTGTNKCYCNKFVGQDFSCPFQFQQFHRHCIAYQYHGAGTFFCTQPQQGGPGQEWKIDWDLTILIRDRCETDVANLWNMVVLITSGGFLVASGSLFVAFNWTTCTPQTTGIGVNSLECQALTGTWTLSRVN